MNNVGKLVLQQSKHIETLEQLVEAQAELIASFREQVALLTTVVETRNEQVIKARNAYLDAVREATAHNLIQGLPANGVVN